MTQELAITYDIYVRAPAKKVWQGIVDGDMTRQYVYGTRLETKLKKGAPYAFVGDGGFKAVDGEILDVAPEKKLVMSWRRTFGAHGGCGIPPTRPIGRRDDIGRFSRGTTRG
jgi:uncharacterized protein YndB with AHSA1/START domain